MNFMEWLGSFNADSFSTLAQKGTESVVKNSPKLLTAAGLAGFATTVFLTIKAKEKADLLINNAKEAKKVETNDENAELTTGEKFKAVLPAYAPVAGMYALSATAVVLSDHIDNKRQVAATAAFTIADASLKEYQQKTLETVGAKKESEIQQKVIESRLEKNPPNTNAMSFAAAHKEYSFFMAPITRQLFFARIDDVNRVMIELDAQMARDTELTLNDILYKLSEVALEMSECGVGIEENDIIGNTYIWTGADELRWRPDAAELPGEPEVKCIYINILTDYKVSVDPRRIEVY